MKDKIITFYKLRKKDVLAGQCSFIFNLIIFLFVRNVSSIIIMRRTHVYRHIGRIDTHGIVGIVSSTRIQWASFKTSTFIYKVHRPSSAVLQACCISFSLFYSTYNTKYRSLTKIYIAKWKLYTRDPPKS